MAVYQCNCEGARSPTCPHCCSRWPTPREFLPGVFDPLTCPYGSPAPAASHHEALCELAGRPLAPPPMGGAAVLYCGEATYWTMLAASVRVLRDVGCTLPVEVWWRSSAGSIRPEDVEGLNVRLVDADAIARDHQDNRVPPRDGGWPAKLYALTHTSYRHMLFLDADAYVAADPSVLLGTGPFAAWEKGLDSTRWDRLGFAARPPKAPRGFQGGQFAVDRLLCWTELVVAHWLCQHRDYYFPAGKSPTEWAIYGDEDALQVSFALSAKPTRVNILGSVEYLNGWGSLCRHEGRVLVEHPFHKKQVPQGTPGEARFFRHYAAVLTGRGD